MHHTNHEQNTDFCLKSEVRVGIYVKDYTRPFTKALFLNL